MKKSLSISLAFAIILAMLPCFSAAAATAAVSSRLPSPQYIAQSFENGLENVKVNTSGCTVAWQEDGANSGKGALQYTTTTNYVAPKFPIRTVAGNTYHISMWVKFDEMPKTQTLNFLFYNPTVETGATAWNEFKSTHEPIVAGKWIELTGTFQCDGLAGNNSGGTYKRVPVYPDGTFELRIGSGIPKQDMESGIHACAIDEVLVYPEVQNLPDESELLIGGDFASEESMKTYWTNQSSGKISWLADGANGTEGSMNISTVKAWGSGKTISAINFQYYKKYRLTYWSKAISDEAVGLAPLIYLTYSNQTDPATPTWEHIYPVTGKNKTLTKNWQLFEYEIYLQKLYQESTFPTLTFRAGTGQEICTYAVDEVSLKQIDNFDFPVLVSGYGSIDTSAGVMYQMSFIQSTSGTFLYRLFDETASGDVLLAKGHTDNGRIAFSKKNFPENAKLRLDVVGADSYGNCTKVQHYYLDEITWDDTVSMRCDQYLWNNDIKELSATVTYQNETKDKQVIAYAAQYNENGALLQVDNEPKTVSAFEDTSWQVKTTAVDGATKVKFYAWNPESLKPIAYESELSKTTSGEFIYVDVNSTATSANGSFDAPYKSLNNARNRLRNRISLSKETDIYVVFKGGEYVPGSYATMDITSRDFSENKNVIYTSLNSDRAKITGAKHITGFKLYDSKKNIYRASVPAGTATRQLYVNGIKATRARSPEGAVPFVNLDQVGASAEFLNLGLTSIDTSFLSYQYPNELEMYFTQNWRHQFVTVDTITATEDGRAHFGFTDNQGKWGGIARCNTPARLPVFVENAYELLDEEGEWYLDTHKNYIYYKPRYFEDMKTADVVIPGVEKLVTMVGTADAPVKNITFKNIDFEYSTWNLPTENRAFINGQNATYTRTDNGGQLMDAAVELHNAHNITFDNCDFSKIGSMALKMTGAIQHCNVIGNEFYELAGGAINLGEVQSNDGISVRYPTEEKHFITDNVIANNYIHKIGTEYKSAAAIGAGFPKNTVIRNNDLSDGPYSGMHTGWGWGSTAPSGTENFVIEKNYIHDFMNWSLYDGGGIYTLGNTGGTEENPNHLRGNYFVDIANHYDAIYPDEGSTGWKISENVCDMHNYPVHYGTENSTSGAIWLHIWTTSIMNIWLENNFSTTYGYREDGTDIEYVEPHVYPTAQWPEEALKIIEEAGIEREYQNRFDFGLQTIRIPRLFEVGIGDTHPLEYNGISSKNRYCDLSDYEITVESSRPDIATATTTEVTGHSAGTAWITFNIVKQVNGEVVHYDEHTFRVVVK